MLFDLQSGRRKNVVRVVYGTLAFLFFIGFVGFSIGSDVSGGIFDALGLTNSGGSAEKGSQFDEQIEKAEKRLAIDPKDEGALLSLARYRFFSGQSKLEVVTEEGQNPVTSESRTEFDASVTAWEDYLEVEKSKPNAGTAAQIVQAYAFLEDAEGAAATQVIVAEGNPSTGTYGNLAFYLYQSGDIAGGREAANKAIAEAEPSERGQLRKDFKKLEKEAIKLKNQQEKAGKAAGDSAGQQLESPFGGLGGP